MLIGKSDAKTDAKGRVFVPATMRRELTKGDENATVVLRRDPNRPCLIVEPIDIFEQRVQQMMERLDVEWNPDDQQLLMEFTADVEQTTLDNQGRLLLNKTHLDFLNAKNTLTFVGMMTHLVIWDAETFVKQRMDADTFAQTLNNKMARKAQP
ncbi:MAG: hypothetical protein Q4D14_02000 [Bacteroidales bacterium]|nr:hypothetical protein [Bacteroidales bacterium]